ncbi:hypothetical protein PINS_up000360 [Pythium insidiosum]|nr:hypothetical protein PINS_up000360 [Pythium insidiosum]
MTMAEYARRSALVGTLSMAWSPFVTNAEQHTTSLIAFCGRAVTTIWAFDHPSFDAFDGVDKAHTDSSSEAPQSLLSSSPFAWIDTERYGWVTACTWQQEHREPSRTITEMRLAMGTSSGNVLLVSVPVIPRDVHVVELPIERVIAVPHAQPVFSLRLGSRSTFSNSPRNDLVVASGSRISVWNIKKKRATPLTWRAHSGNVTGLDVDYFGKQVFSSGVDGCLRLWDGTTGEEIPFVTTTASPDDENPGAILLSPRPRNDTSQAKYPMYGVSVSPNSAQLVCLYVVPPAARPNRKSQADVSYSRVSSALEYLPSPYSTRPEIFVSTIRQVLQESRDISSLTDVLWFCHQDNANLTSLHQGPSDSSLSSLFQMLPGVKAIGQDVNGKSRQPLYLKLCEALEKEYYEPDPDDPITASDGAPLSLQASYLLRSCITPSESHQTIREDALQKIKRTLYTYWAERCLKELLASHSQVQNLSDISKTERISALLMADFLSVQQPMSESSERLVTTIYNRLGSEDNVSRWSEYLQNRVSAAASKSEETSVSGGTHSEADSTSTTPLPPVPPPRQTCYICNEAVPFGELEQFCAAGHIQDRCFLSFQVISSMDTWKCMGCGAAASEIDFSQGRSPFYLLESQTKKALKVSNLAIVCRLCGNYCSFLHY